jgi:hypothetical protein
MTQRTTSCGVAWLAVGWWLASSGAAGEIPPAEWSLGAGVQVADGVAVAAVPPDSLVGDLVAGLKKPLELAAGVQPS